MLLNAKYVVNYMPVLPKYCYCVKTCTLRLKLSSKEIKVSVRSIPLSSVTHRVIQTVID